MSLKDRNKQFPIDRTRQNSDYRKMSAASTGTTLQDRCNELTAQQLEKWRRGES